MDPIYHLVTPEAWAASGSDYRPDSLGREGFVHCSLAHQVARSANTYYAAAPELLLLTIDPHKLEASLLLEPASSGERFPHVHGPLNRSAVVAVRALARGAGGAWLFPS